MTSDKTHAERCTGPLTGRQQEIAQMVGRALPNSEIARRLGLHTNTVKVQVTYILAKLNFRNRVELALWVNGRQAA